MYINVLTLQSLFQDKPSRCHVSQNAACLTGFQHLSQIVHYRSLHTLYMTDDCEQLEKLSDSQALSLLLLTNNLPKAEATLQKRKNDQCSYLIVENCTLTEAGTRLQKHFDIKCGCGLMADSLISFLFQDSNLQELISFVASHVLQNPVFVFDAGFNLLAAYTDFPTMDSTDHAFQIVQNQGFTNEDFILARSSKTHKKIMATEEPIMAYNEMHHVNQLLCSITTRRNIGHIVMNASCHEFEQSDYELFYLLKKVVHERLQKSEFIRNNKGYNFEYYLRDLLSQKTTANRKYLNCIDSFASEMVGNFQCLVVEGANRGDPLDLKHIRNLFDNRLSNTRSVIFGNNQLVVVLCLGERDYLRQSDFQQINAICEAQFLCAGISNTFSDIIELHDYYNQALRAIEIGIQQSQNPGLYCYQDYYLLHVMRLFSQKESAQTFSHPVIRRLSEYDKSAGTELALTLTEWLRCERNASVAAEHLNVHRNTLINRLRKIDQLVDIDYDNPSLRQYLIMSYDFCNMEKEL